jgi:hypothetical protein
MNSRNLETGVVFRPPNPGDPALFYEVLNTEARPRADSLKRLIVGASLFPEPVFLHV